MPWQASDAQKHNKGLNKSQQKQWSSVANAILGKTGNEGKAVRIANGAVSKGAVQRRLESGGKKK